MGILSDMKFAPKIINICRQPRTFIKWHAGITVITGLILIIIVIVIGMIFYLSDPPEKDNDDKITRRNFGLATMVNAYMLLICLIIIWIVPVVFLGFKYKLI